MNVLGLRHVLQVCHKMEKLECMVHISTAYANCDRNEIFETVYEAPTSPDKLIGSLE